MRTDPTPERCPAWPAFQVSEEAPNHSPHDGRVPTIHRVSPARRATHVPSRGWQRSGSLRWRTTAVPDHRGCRSSRRPIAKRGLAGLEWWAQHPARGARDGTRGDRGARVFGEPRRAKPGSWALEHGGLPALRGDRPPPRGSQLRDVHPNLLTGAAPKGAPPACRGRGRRGRGGVVRDLPQHRLRRWDLAPPSCGERPPVRPIGSQPAGGRGARPAAWI